MAGRRVDTVQVKPYIHIETAVLLDLLQDKLDIPKGRLIEKLINESPTFTTFKDKYKSLLEQI